MASSLDDEYIDIDISIRDLVEFDPDIGTESCHIFGSMGSGKSNFGYGVILTALLDRNEFAIMPGDVACEWRHFPKHSDYNLGITVIVPEGVDIFYSSGTKENENDGELKRLRKSSGWFEEVDYETLEVFKYLKKDKPLLVIYDQHLKIADRSKLWGVVLEQVVRRHVEMHRAINFLMHEAGVLFPESARGKHWSNIKDFGETFVETRKMGVRVFFISQLETEIEYTIRRKCNFKIVKKSFLRGEYAKPVRKSAPFLRVDEYIIVYGGMYRLDNDFKETDEYKSIWKMVPPIAKKNNEVENNFTGDGESIRGDSVSNNHKENSQKCSNCGYIWTSRKLNPKECPQCKARIKYKESDINE